MERFTIENDELKVGINAVGAELSSVVIKATGEERIWKGDPGIWPSQAPLLFPHCGKLWDGVLKAEGKEYPAGQHGFARRAVFEPEMQQKDKIVLTLADLAEARRVYPYAFTLRVEFSLEGATVTQKVLVENQETEKPLPFNVGFHPGFSLPFGEGRTTEDFSIVFDQKETPTLHLTPGGYISGETRVLFEGQDRVPLRDDMFVNDSLCMSGLVSSHISLLGPDGKGVKVKVEGFPYVLLWSQPKGPLPYVCIEPWHGVPDGPAQYDDFSKKPGVTLLAPGGEYQAVLEMEFI